MDLHTQNSFRIETGQRAELNTSELSDELLRLERHLEESNALFSTIFSNSGVGIALARPNGTLMRANQALCDMLGYDEEELKNKTVAELTHPEDVAINQELFLQCVSGQRDTYSFEKRYLKKNKDIIWASLSASYNRASDEQDSFMVAVITDITERKQREEEIRYQANYDSLTGLPNRLLFTDRLNQNIQRASRDGNSIYVLFIDLDGFKDINDALGHETGDELLQQVASRLQGCVRKSDTVARFGGDEYVIMIAGDIGPHTVDRVINQIFEQLQQPFTLREGTHRLSASIGISVYPHDATEVSTLLRYADTAMYRVKDSGRGGFAFFHADMNKQAVERAQVKQAIFEAIEHKEFNLHYQPVVDLESNTVVGAEALLRWLPKTSSLVTTDKIISISEETGQIVMIGQLVMEQAIQQMSLWHRSINADLYIAINLSPRQLYEDSLVQFIRELPEESLRHLTFEITESVFLETHKAALNTIRLIRDKGGKISIDDFGTGYSSLQYLQNFPVDVVKIDQSFIRKEAVIRRPNDAFIEAILVMAQGIGANVVAEGVETHEQFEFLKSKDCRYIQGFYFSKPLPPQAFEQFVKTWKS